MTFSRHLVVTVSSHFCRKLNFLFVFLLVWFLDSISWKMSPEGSGPVWDRLLHQPKKCEDVVAQLETSRFCVPSAEETLKGTEVDPEGQFVCLTAGPGSYQVSSSPGRIQTTLTFTVMDRILVCT